MTTMTPTKAAAQIIQVGRIVADEPRVHPQYITSWAAHVVAYLDGPAGKLRAELLAWAKNWREASCDRLGDCEPSTGSHDDHCAITVNEIDGMALVDSLRIAEHEERTQ